MKNNTLNVKFPFFAKTPAGVYWSQNPARGPQYLAITSEGELIEVTYVKGSGDYVVKKLTNYTLTNEPPVADSQSEEIKVIDCPACRGEGRANEIVSHDDHGAVYEMCVCLKCSGSGKVPENKEQRK